MPESDAVNLVNWIPDTFGVRCRKGYREWAINFPGGAAVKSLLTYLPATATFPGGAFLTVPNSLPGKTFAATDTAIYEITSSTSAPASSKVLSGATDAGWLASTMFANTSGSYLAVTSEADGYFYYNGTAWTTPTLTGVSASALVYVTSWKRRLLFVERNTTNLWYLAADAIAGTATKFDLGPLFPNGGSLSFLTSWTIDAGEGIDDYLVAVSSAGDVIVYKGTDPASATDFSLAGRWFIGQIPVGRRGYMQYGGDLLLLSTQGVFPLSVLSSQGAARMLGEQNEYSKLVRYPLGKDLQATFTQRGWEMMQHPGERVLIINVPNYSGATNKQYAMATSLNRWCLFSGIPISCMGFNSGYMLAGTSDGRVLLVLVGYFDAVDYGESQGTGISGAITPAFSYFGSAAQEKSFLLVRPNFLSSDTPSVLVDVSVNFSTTPPTGTPTYAASTASLWDTATWDTGIWAGAQRAYAEWAGVGAVGVSGTANLSTICVADTVLTSIDYVYAVGGPL
jgi:hypothetical protein